MSSAQWEVVPDAGQRCLDRVSQDVIIWNRYGSQLEDFKNTMDFWNAEAEPVTRLRVNDALAQGDADSLEQLVIEIALKDLRGISQAQVGEVTLSRLVELEQGTHFRAFRQRARFNVIESGVSRQVGLFDEGHGINVRLRTESLEEGRVIEGKIMDFISLPREGGNLRLEHRFLQSFTTGLVNPSNGRPRVELDILEKNK
jgi:hypothetical protein